MRSGSERSPGRSQQPRPALYRLTAGTLHIGIVAVLVFSRRVFRSEARLASGGVSAGAVSLALIRVLNSRMLLTAPDAAAYAERARPVRVSSFGVCSAAFFWTALESLTSWRRPERRVALGLANSAVPFIAFFAPRGYLAWLESRAHVSSA